MIYEYKVVRRIRKKRVFEETGVISGPDAFAMALRHAEFWAKQKESKYVSIVQAACEGVNAGKFFLHQLVKT